MDEDEVLLERIAMVISHRLDEVRDGQVTDALLLDIVHMVRADSARAFARLCDALADKFEATPPAGFAARSEDWRAGYLASLRDMFVRMTP
jgi:hypothetical protein